MFCFALITCARSRDIHPERCVHEHAGKVGYDPFLLMSNSNVIFATSILEMYTKCVIMSF
jgi:hypothetical protein